MVSKKFFLILDLGIHLYKKYLVIEVEKVKIGKKVKRSDGL